MKTILSITDKDITGSSKLSPAKPRIAVGAVLFDCDNNIALSYIGNWGIYTLPGGGVDDGEDFLTAVKREMREETGCDCEITGEIGTTYQNSAEEEFVMEKHHYIAKVVGEKGELNLEEYEIASGTTVRWYPLEQALQAISEQAISERAHEIIRYSEFQRRRDIAVLEEVIRLKIKIQN